MSTPNIGIAPSFAKSLSTNEFGKRVRQLRSRRHNDSGRAWSQDDLAAAVRVSRNTVQSWESGTMPRGAMLERLAKALDTTPDFLLASGEGPSPIQRAYLGSRAPGVVSEPAPDLPTPARLRQHEIERELIEAGASEQQVSDFRRSVRESPLIRELFNGTPISEEDALRLYEGVALGFRRIIEQMLPRPMSHGPSVIQEPADIVFDESSRAPTARRPVAKTAKKNPPKSA